MISIVLPAYNEKDLISHAAQKLTDVLMPLDIKYELVFVDDGSTDDTYGQILRLSCENSCIRGLRFSRNFGKEAAIFAGLKAARGDCCVVMDCDMQHPPDVIPRMVAYWREGYQIVEGVKADRGDETRAHAFSSGLFYGIISRLTGFDMKNSSDFKLLDRTVIDILTTLPEKHMFFRGLSFWVGFRTRKVEYKVAPRLYGTTKWSIWKLIKYALRNITSFSSAPLQIVTVLGGIFLFASVILGIQTLVRFFMGFAMEGFTTVVLLLLIVGGSLMVSLGLIGSYIAKIYDEVKNRPRYIVMDSTDRENKA